MEQEYERKESEALRQAERLRLEQEKRYIAQMEEVRAHNADLVADAIRVRELFAQVQSTRSPDLERSHHRIERCEQLLSTAYSLAGEGEALLRERDARLEAVR